jgi:hypothetical protein
MLTDELTRELLSTAAQVAAFVIALPTAEARCWLFAADQHIFVAVAEAFGDEIGALAADAFSKTVKANCAELVAARKGKLH